MFYFIMCTLIVKYSVKSCYCCLFYVLAFQDQHTLPKWNILWKAVIVACSMYWPFRTSTPSQSEIFCLKALIVDLREYFTLGGCAGPERPIATITALRQNISLWEGVLVLKGQYIEQGTITALRQNISLWEGVLVLKGQYIEQATITALRQNLSLWEGVLVLKEVNCQKDVNCQIIKYLDYGGGSQKKKIDIMRFTHIYVNFDVTYEGY